MTHELSAGQSKIIDLLQDAIPELATGYNGKAVILPNLEKVFEVTGITKAAWYRFPGGLEQSFHQATGLTVIARQAIILGTPEAVTSYDADFVDQAKSDLKVEQLANAAEMMTPEQKQALIARLALSE